MAICEKCGDDNPPGAAFCVICGAPVKVIAAEEFSTEIAPVIAPIPEPLQKSVIPTNTRKFCTACGKELVPSAIICPACGSPTGKRKDKSVAVLLAVFLTFWTWTYTYDRDKGKFWIGLGLSIFGVITAFLIIGWFILFGVWLWAVIATATRPFEFYEHFPNR